MAPELRNNYHKHEPRVQQCGILSGKKSFKEMSIATVGDPVDLFDASANGSVKWNPFTSRSLIHTFDNLAENHLSTSIEHAFGWKNKTEAFR